MQNIMDEIIKYNQQQVEHVRLFQQLVRSFCNELMEQAIDHDQSKFSMEEYETFVQSRMSLNNSTTGKDELYQKQYFSAGIQHHVKSNPHHPEYWENFFGERSMPLVQIICMYFDWKSRSIQRGTKMGDFWGYNVEKLKTTKQDHAIGVVEILRKDDGEDGDKP